MKAPRPEPTLKVSLPYTATQANKALPLVRRIVADLVGFVRAWEDAVREVELTAHDNSLDNPESERSQREAQRLAAEVDHYVRELSELGVEVKALDIGLVDFPGTLDGRDVSFCWSLDEHAVTHWHERDAGFAGRQPLPVGALAEHG